MPGPPVADRVTVSGVDARSNVVEGSGDATVRIQGQTPEITISKAANPTRVKNPGGNVTFTVTVTNTSPAGSADPIAITSIVDSVESGAPFSVSGMGNCNSAGNPYPTALAKDSSYTCSFTRYVAGDGVTKTRETDTVTAVFQDDDVATGSASNSATVNIAPAAVQGPEAPPQRLAPCASSLPFAHQAQ